MNLETFGGLSAILAVLFFLACVILGIAALIMPIVVFYIHRRTEEIAKILSSMEDMMRNGK